MNISVIGTGYVGVVVGACLAESGNDVICVDVDHDKVDRLSRGDVPIYEPGLEPLIERNLAARRLSFTTDVAAAVQASGIVFIAVGTPPDEDGSADLSHVLDVARAIGKAMNREKIVITKSTVPVGTARRVREAIEAETQHPVHVCSNPEFLKEGNAVEDFMRPDRIVLGADSNRAARALQELYAPFVRTGHPILMMDVASAEITKYAANAMLATRVSFMNLIARLCEQTGANAEDVRRGVGSDVRIGSSFLFPGVGFGGSCFPKDVKALTKTMVEVGVDATLLQAVDEVNEQQKRTLLERLVARMGDDLSHKAVAVWGLAFKPETDDMREAPSLVTIEGLLGRGARVAVHDPAALEEARRRFGDRIEYATDNYEALLGASALVIHTEWRPYRQPNFARMRRAMASPLIFDGRNLYDPETVAREGFEYVSIGRPRAVTDTARGRFLLPVRKRPESTVVSAAGAVTTT
jgi:UDPglucose 6-dehydrogenase